MRSKASTFMGAVGIAIGLCSIAQAANQASGVDPTTGLATAVVVENKALAHTAQLLPIDQDGKVVGDTLDAQLAQVVKNTGTVLGEVGSGLNEIARLNVFVTTNALVGEATALLKNHLGPDAHPAVTFVVAKLSDPAALVGLDAIASVNDAKAPASVLRHTSSALPARHGMAHVAVLPRGRALYVSGMSELGTQDQAAASTGTMKQLHGVLALNKIGPEHVVHLKAYMKPTESVPAAEQAMAEFYPGAPAPPMTFVDWLNDIPTEIEMIAWIPESSESDDPVLHLWPAEVTPSNVYCRYAVVNSATRIYTKGFTASSALDPAGQVHDIFAQLKAAIEPLGSDFRHLVKATYYVTADDTSTALNQIRPEYYDPQRPPAASKATVAGTGFADRGLVLDMIAAGK
jgi:enamine deaminase RidA (YjgF/YER057c/UK114 family)